MPATPAINRAARLAALSAEQMEIWLGLAPVLERMAFDPPQFDPYLAKLRRLAQPEPVASASALAALLQSSEGLAAVVRGLDVTSRSLILLACWRGGTLQREDVIGTDAWQQNADLGKEEELGAAADRLRFLLLAEPAEPAEPAGTSNTADATSKGQPGPWLSIPADVRAVVALPGIAAAPSLVGIVSDELAATLRANNIKDIPTRRDERAELLLKLLKDRTHLESLAATLSHEARRVLGLLLRNITPMQPYELGVHSLGVAGRRYQPASRYATSAPTSVGTGKPAVAELYEAGLVGVETYEESTWVWREVAQTLRPALIPSWETAPAPVQVAFDADRSHIARPLANLERLLDLWRASPPPALADGGVGVAPVRAVAKKIGIKPGHAGLLVHLAVGLRLLECSVVSIEGRGRNARPVHGWATTDAVQDWLQRPAVERWTILVHRWMTDDTLLDSDGLPERWAPGYREADTLRRHLVLRTLERYEVGHCAWAMEAINQTTSSWPQLVWPSQAAAAIEALRALGMVEPEGRVGLTNAARALLDGTLKDQVDAAGPGAAAGSSKFVVQGDSTVIATPDVDLDSRLFLDRIATLESDAGARVYRLTEASLTAALAGGLSVADIEQGLVTRSQTTVPQSVSYLIADVERKRKLITLASAVTTIASADPALIASAIRVKAAGLRELGPYTAVSALPAAKVRAALAAKGVMVTVEQAASPPPPLMSSFGRRDEHTPPKVGPSPYIGRLTLRDEAARLVSGPAAVVPSSKKK